MSSVPRIAANISVLFRELPLLERFAAARDAGFDGVELQFPYAEDAGRLARAADDAGLPVILINAPVAPGYGFGLAGCPEMRDEFRSLLRLTCDYGAVLRVKFVHVLAGLASIPREDSRSWATYIDNLSYAAEVLNAHGIVTLIEPLNSFDAPDYLLGSFEAAERVLGCCAGRVGLQFDAYHAARMRLDPSEAFKRMARWIRHVQFADSPGRHEPGTGEVRFDALLGALEATQYDGWISAEYLPIGRTLDGLQWLRAWRASR